MRLNDFPLKAQRAGLISVARGDFNRFAHAKRLKSLLKRAGDLNLLRLPYAGGGPYAGRAVPSGTRYWPSGCNLHGPRAGIISVARGDFIPILLSQNG